MRRLWAWLLMLTMLLTSASGAYAQEAMVMAGYDDASVGHEWETNLFFKRMAKVTGVEFAYDQYSEYEQWTAAKAAMVDGSKALPDVIFKAELTLAETEALYQAGKIIDLKPYLAEHAPRLWALLEANPDWMEAVTLPTGEIVALPAINELQSNNSMWINKTWLTKLGLDMPSTAQELTEVLRAFRDLDPNMNGKQDEIPLTFIGMWDLKFLGHAFGVVTNDYNLYVDEQGTVREALTSQNNRAFVTWLRELWAEKLLDRNGFMNTDSLRQISDKDATIPFGVIMAATPLSVIPASAIGDYTILMPLEYEGKQVYRDLCGDLVRGTFAVTSACKDVAKALAWVDYLYTEEGFRLAQAGEEGEEYVWNEDGTWTWLASAESMANSILQTSTILDGGDMPGMYSIPFQMAYEESQTAAAIRDMSALKAYSITPYPLTYPTQAQLKRANEIQMELGYYADVTMARFVTGDYELTDESWNTFCQTLSDMGMTELVSIWQDALQ